MFNNLFPFYEDPMFSNVFNSMPISTMGDRRIQEPNNILQSRHHANNRYLRNSMNVMPYGIGNIFNQMDNLTNGLMGHNMFPNMGQIMSQISNNNCSNGYSHSSVMTFSNDANGGQPHVYQESHSTRMAPGGVKETRKVIKDSRTGKEKLSIGHHIGERAHVIKKKKNVLTGEEEEEEEFVNFDEEQAQQFNQEWLNKTKVRNNMISRGQGPSKKQQNNLAIMPSHGHGTQSNAISAPSVHNPSTSKQHGTKRQRSKF